MKAVFCKIQLLTSFILLFFCFTIQLSAQQSERLFTLDESIVTAIHNSQELLSLSEQIEIAKNRINEARSQIYPKIDFNLSLSQFDNNTPTVLAPSFSSIYLPDTNKEIYYFTRFSLWQYLYAGGRYTTNLRLAEINLSKASSQYEAAKNEVVKETKKAFYDCLAAGQKVKTYEMTLNEIKELAEKKPLQKARWALFSGHVKLNLLKARHESEKTALNFLDTIGLELYTLFELQGELSVLEAEYNLNKCLAWAYENRPELKKTQFEETIDSLKVNLSLTERYPTITLGANYEWVGDQFPLTNKSWNATLNLSVPIFDGWASWARIKQRKNQAREGKIRRAKIEDQMRFEVRNAYLDYNFWINQLAAIKSTQTKELEPDAKLENMLLLIETTQQALNSQADLECAIGTNSPK